MTATYTLQCEYALMPRGHRRRFKSACPESDRRGVATPGRQELNSTRSEHAGGARSCHLLALLSLASEPHLSPHQGGHVSITYPPHTDNLYPISKDWRGVVVGDLGTICSVLGTRDAGAMVM